MHHQYLIQMPRSKRHCVINGVESWSGVLEWSLGVEFGVIIWSGMKLDFGHLFIR